jgi:hypothetical protein
MNLYLLAHQTLVSRLQILTWLAKYVLLRAKKVGHQISVSFEKFDVVQALLSFF